MLSICILVRDCSQDLERAILSILPIASEIIIIDDNSRDNTVSIAKKYHAKVYRHTLNNDFSAQRNYAIKKCSGDWIFFLDSDEVVTQELKEEIQYLSSLKEYTGIRFKRQDIFLGKALKYGETSSVRLIRMARRMSGEWKRTVHEYWDIKGTIYDAYNPIVHYPHATMTDFITSINTYSSINAEFFYKSNSRVSILMIWIYPIAKFILNYCIHLGFLDGTRGMIMACGMSYHSFLTRAKIWELSKKK